jgi:hypothetical protein
MLKESRSNACRQRRTKNNPVPCSTPPATGGNCGRRTCPAGWMGETGGIPATFRMNNIHVANRQSRARFTVPRCLVGKSERLHLVMDVRGEYNGCTSTAMNSRCLGLRPASSSTPPAAPANARTRHTDVRTAARARSIETSDRNSFTRVQSRVCRAFHFQLSLFFSVAAQVLKNPPVALRSIEALTHCLLPSCTVPPPVQAALYNWSPLPHSTVDLTVVRA